VVCQRIGKACELIGQEFVHGDRGRGGRAPRAKQDSKAVSLLVAASETRTTA
jgi:hypothetical protein